MTTVTDSFSIKTILFAEKGMTRAWETQIPNRFIIKFKYILEHFVFSHN